MEIVLIRSLILISYVTAIKGSAVRIAGGYEAPEHYGQFHASLQNLNGLHVCGAAIITAHHVLTAAHCVDGVDPKYITVVVGTTNLDKGGERYNVTHINIHNHFEFNLRLHDIAILKIFGFFDIRIINVMELSSEYLTEGYPVILSGFGAQEPQGVTGPQMYALDLTVFDQEICRFAMRYNKNVTDEMFCTFTRMGEGTCHGDSGGPLMKDNKLVGIVSWGIPCAAGFPDVHTRIAPYIPWIQEILTKNQGLCRSSFSPLIFTKSA